MTMTLLHDHADARMLRLFVEAAEAAGREALRIREGGLAVEAKADFSPVTAADRAAEAIIEKQLSSAFPGLPIIAEEAVSEGRVPPELGRRFVLIDPIDGTKEFVAGRADFTVNVALIEDGVPVLGVVHVPALGETFAGSPAGATKRSLGVAAAGESREIRAAPLPARPRALVSRSHLSAETEAFLGRHDLQSVEKVGSSLKFCRLAEGAADLYPCLRRTMEWDTAAGQAVLEAAGGVVETLDGSRLVYGKRRQAGDADFANPHFIAAGRR